MNSVSESTTPAEGPLSPEELSRIDAYFRATNYLSVGQIYLLDNPLLREPLQRKHVKPRLHPCVHDRYDFGTLSNRAVAT